MSSAQAHAAEFIKIFVIISKWYKLVTTLVVSSPDRPTSASSANAIFCHISEFCKLNICNPPPMLKQSFPGFLSILSGLCNFAIASQNLGFCKQ